MAEAIRWQNVTVCPVVHGRLAFALEVRRLMLAQRFDRVVVELPPSLEGAVRRGIDALPRICGVFYGDLGATWRPEAEEGGRRAWYVPIDPSDAMIEAVRIAMRERTPIHFIDAEVDEFEPRPMVVPDAHAVHTLGLARWFDAVEPVLALRPKTAQDEIRERHMAACLRLFTEGPFAGRNVLFVCGLGHWSAIRACLESNGDAFHEGEAIDEDAIRVEPIHPASLIHVLGEMPYLTYLWEKHRAGIEPDAFDHVDGLKRLVLKAKASFERRFPDAIEKPTMPALRALFAYLRKLCLLQRRLLPDSYLLTVAAKGTVGNDFAVRLLELSNRYPPNRMRGDSVQMSDQHAKLDDDGEPHDAQTRTPGEAMSLRPLELERRPRRRDAASWRRGWDPHGHCSWPPEDVAIENFRAHVTKRALTLAGLSLRKTEPFTSALKDGIAVRETLRDWHVGKIHVKEEPPVAGDVGALVIIFEEDDDGTRFPWRTTWFAEHEEESTLAFYATDPLADMVGPGIGRIHYGGCMFLYPPIPIPDVWEDLRLERARRPSERLLLAALLWGRERFVAYAAPTPPAAEVKAEAARLGKHIVYLPLSTFSPQALERLRFAHVLNGRQVRSWASRYIR